MATRRKAAKTTETTKAAVYVRVSSEKQVESGLGFEDQKERLAGYCALRGLEMVELVTDAGESAGKPLSGRPGGRRLLALVKSRKVGSVVILKLDRAFRNTVDALITVKAWEAQGVALHVADMGGMAIDTGSAVGELFLTMLAGFATFERALTAERTTAALAQKARSGNMRLGGEAPYGWRYAGDRLAEVAAEQETIAMVRELHEAGVSYRQTCTTLARRGRFNRAGNTFAPVQISRILAGSVRQMHATS